MKTSKLVASILGLIFFLFLAFGSSDDSGSEKKSNTETSRFETSGSAQSSQSNEVDIPANEPNIHANEPSIPGNYISSGDCRAFSNVLLTHSFVSEDGFMNIWFGRSVSADSECAGTVGGTIDARGQHQSFRGTFEVDKIGVFLCDIENITTFDRGIKKFMIVTDQLIVMDGIKLYKHN